MHTANQTFDRSAPTVSRAAALRVSTRRTTAPRTTDTRSSLLDYGALVIAAAAADLLTKWIAVASLGQGSTVELMDRLSLMLVFNTGSAGGVMVGPYTWQLNVLVTLAALVLITVVAPSLIAVDRNARVSLGLVAGGALGNLASMLFGPAGVADFLALRLAGDTIIVMNVADLELWAGALLLLPVVLTLVRAIRAERAADAIGGA